jgi:hypothetical protein
MVYTHHYTKHVSPFSSAPDGSQYRSSFRTWTDDGLLRQTVYVRLPADKPASEVRRETPGPQDRRDAFSAAWD